MLRFLAN